MARLLTYLIDFLWKLSLGSELYSKLEEQRKNNFSFWRPFSLSCSLQIFCCAISICFITNYFHQKMNLTSPLLLSVGSSQFLIFKYEFLFTWNVLQQHSLNNEWVILLTALVIYYFNGCNRHTFSTSPYYNSWLFTNHIVPLLYLR